VRFAIVGNPRTGSSHLVSLLDSHPDVACWDDEIFDEGEAFDKSACACPKDFLLERVFPVNGIAVGFKLLWDALGRLRNGWELLREMDIRVIHTYRANRLDSFLSFQLARINKAFTSWYGDYKTHEFEAGYDEILEWFRTTEERDLEIARQAEAWSVPRLAIEYNELCRDQTRILEFLGAPPHLLTSRLTKQRRGRQSEILRNYEELKSTFKGSMWSEYFED
jgi:LPS sulfotransferase NodH